MAAWRSRGFWSFAFLWTGVACGSSETDTGSGGDGSGSMTSPASAGSGADAEAEMLAAHNAVRAGVSPPATPPMAPLEWSSDLAKTASDYAAKCVFEHSKTSHGENLFASTQNTPPQKVVASWADEVKDFDYASNQCQGNAVCGHYTQIVWAKTLRLGCGVADCTQNSPFQGASSRWQNWVCHYDPPGNFVGQKPY